MLVAGCYFLQFVLCLSLFMVCLFRGMERQYREGMPGRDIMADVSDPVCLLCVDDVLKLERRMKRERDCAGLLD